MNTPQNDNPTSSDSPRKETNLVSRSGFLARRTRELAQQVRDLNLADGLEVVFPDKNLEAAVREALEKPEGPLTRGDLKRLDDELAADKAGIENLFGLDHAINLTKLTLANNQISDLSPLASLTNLTLLRLDSNQISDLSPLASLTNLIELRLNFNQISDISPLASLIASNLKVFLDSNPLNQKSIDVHLPDLRARGLDVDFADR